MCNKITHDALNSQRGFGPHAVLKPATTGAQALASKAFERLDQDSAGRDQAPAGGESGGNCEGLNEQRWKEFGVGASQ